MSLDRYRLEHARHTARRPHRLSGIAAAEQDLFAGLQVGGDDAQRQLHCLDRPVLHLAVDVVLQRLALEPAAKTGAEGQGPVGDRRLVHGQRQLVQPEAVQAARVQRGHDRACAGAGHQVGMDALRLQRLDHADMGKAARGAAAKRQADPDRARSGRGGGGGCRRRRRARAEGAARQQGGRGEAEEMTSLHEAGSVNRGWPVMR
ncbi:hypothetical protein D9M72_517000 [compost metagenome]